MDSGKSTGAQMAVASQLEKKGQLVEAVNIYQKLFESDRNNRQVITRLLIVYRKLKDYKKELVVLNDALAAQNLRQKIARDQWIESHPQAASAGKSMLRQLEKSGSAQAGLTGDPSVEGWLKRKQLVTARINGKKAKVIKHSRQSQKPTVGATSPQSKLTPSKAGAPRTAPTLQPSQNLAKTNKPQLKKDKQRQQKQNKQRHLKEKKLQQKEEKRRQQKEDKQRRIQEARAAREEAAQQRKTAVLEARRQKLQHPSLFLIILTYRANLDKIDAAMKQHMAYLAKHYDNGDFLVSGRRIPRTGGVILARAANRAALEKKVVRDPFLKHKLATVDIIEFNPSQMVQGLKKWLIPSTPK